MCACVCVCVCVLSGGGWARAHGEGRVDDELAQHVERRVLCEAHEHDVLAVGGRRARVDAKRAEREELRLEDAKVGEDRERDVAQHRKVPAAADEAAPGGRVSRGTRHVQASCSVHPIR